MSHKHAWQIIKLFLLLIKDPVIKVHGGCGGVRVQDHVSVALLPGLKPLTAVSFFDTKPIEFPLFYFILRRWIKWKNWLKCEKRNRDRTVCSCRHSKSSSWVRSMYSVWRPYCVQLYIQQVISMDQKHVQCMETVLCAAVGTACHQHGLEACTVCGDRTVCSCRHTMSSAWVRSMYCLTFRHRASSI